MVTVTKDVRDMAYLLPPSSMSHKIGAAVKTALIGRVVSEVPGKETLGTWPATHDESYRSVFFPNYKKQPFQDNCPGNLSGFSVALLCGVMKKIADGTLRSQLNGSKINSTISSYNSNLTPQMPVVYAQAMKQMWPDFDQLYQKVKNDLSSARQQYRQALIDGAAEHALWEANGEWNSPTYECFQHWCKYMALGATPADVDALINDLIAAKFPIPSAANVQNWRMYPNYGYSPVAAGDIESQCRSGVTSDIYMPNPMGMGSWLHSGHSYDFTSHGSPGNSYRDLPSGGSCFAAGTVVLMEDKQTCKPVEELKVGDRIWSPSAKKGVAIAAIARPFLAGRGLYSFNNDETFRFTDSHPFRIVEALEEKGLVACVNPMALCRYAPTWSSFGVQTLEKGKKLRHFTLENGGMIKENTFEVVSVDTVCPPIQSENFEQWTEQIQQDGESRIFLYDIILEQTECCEGGYPVDYLAGTPSMLLQVHTEIPPIASEDVNVLTTTASVITSIAQLSGPFDQLINSTDLGSSEQCKKIASFYVGVNSMVPILKSKWLTTLHALLSPTLMSTDNRKDLQLSDIASDFFKHSSPEASEEVMLMSMSTSFRSAMSRLYEQFLSLHTQELVTFFELGFRLIPSPLPESIPNFTGDMVLAVTVWGIQLHASLVSDSTISKLNELTLQKLKVSIFESDESMQELTSYSSISTCSEMNYFHTNKLARFWLSPLSNRISYYKLDNTDAIGTSAFNVQLSATLTDGMEGNLDIVSNIKNRYQPFSIPISTPIKEVPRSPYDDSPMKLPLPFIEQGQVLMDVRLLTLEEASLEQDKSKTWGMEQASDLAKKILPSAGKAYETLVTETLSKIEIH